MTKLTDAKIRWLVNKVTRHGYSFAEAARHQGVTRMRVKQLVDEYRASGCIPMLSTKRRPHTVLSHEQKRAIDQLYQRKRVGARLLYQELRAQGYVVPKNKLNAYMREKGYATANPRKQKRRTRCRYERQHSGSLLHGDWHRTSEEHPHCILWEDDASRMILAGAEVSRQSADVSAATLEEACAVCAQRNVTVRQVNTDRGPEFFENKGGTNRFQRYLEARGITHVLSRTNNPQTNGKIERLWREYDQHRWRFDSLEEFIEWYNDRLHGALMLEWAETPQMAFQRKMPPEALIGVMFG